LTCLNYIPRSSPVPFRFRRRLGEGWPSQTAASRLGVTRMTEAPVRPRFWFTRRNMQLLDRLEARLAISTTHFSSTKCTLNIPRWRYIHLHTRLPQSLWSPRHGELKSRPPPNIPVDLKQVALLVREADLALLVEARLLEIVCKPTLVSFPFRMQLQPTYFSLSTRGSSMTLSVRLSANQQ
jgi:hypothetical protein